MSIANKALTSYLLPYQHVWIRDKRKKKASLKARQIGFTHATGLEVLLHALKHPRHNCFCVSVTQTAAIRQMVQEVRFWIEVLKKDPVYEPHLRLVKDAQGEIHLPNGSKIIAVAHEPARLRGYTKSSYWFDEAGWWPKRILDGIMESVLPQVDTGRNPDGVIRWLSTPGFKGTLFHEICEGAKHKSGPYADYSLHEVDIYKAVQEGHPFNLELKKSYPINKWQVEYELQWIEGGGNYYDREVILDHEVDDIPDRGIVCAGVDLAKVSDYTSIVITRRMTNKVVVTHTYMMRAMNYNEQAALIGQLLQQHHVTVCEVDITAHQSFVDQLLFRVPSLTRIVRPRQFTNPWKVHYTEMLKTALDTHVVEFCFDSYIYSGGWEKTPTKFLLDDLVRVRQMQTAGGSVTYEVPRSKDVAGHGDSYSALLLALSAGKNPAPATIDPIQIRSAADQLRGF